MAIARSLMDRCHEVEQFLRDQQEARLVSAKMLLAADENEKILYAVQYLQEELRMHREVRTLWPYLLAIPDSQEAHKFCSLYGCPLEGFGDIVQARIDQLRESLDVVNDRMLRDNPAAFWAEMRKQLIVKIAEEARQIVEGTF